MSVASGSLRVVGEILWMPLRAGFAYRAIENGYNRKNPCIVSEIRIFWYFYSDRELDFINRKTHIERVEDCLRAVFVSVCWKVSERNPHSEKVSDEDHRSQKIRVTPCFIV